MDTFQPRIPYTHPFVNAPVSLQNPTPLQNPVNVYMSGQPLTHNTTTPSALHPQPQPQTTSFAFSPIHNPVFPSAASSPLITPPNSTCKTRYT